MTLYVVLICDRHTDPEVKLFTDAERAVQAAEEHAEEMGWEEYTLPDDGPWLYAATHPTESDSLHVVATEVIA